MQNISNIFGEMVNRQDSSSVSKSFQLNESSATLSSEDSLLPSGPQEEFLLQRYIRPLYGKDGVNAQPIGTPPDFLELENDDEHSIFHYTCTMFVDIKGSTRLNLLYSPEDVHKFKNSVLQVCIETVRAHDGHVHRLMGDAVLAFFGGKSTEKEDSVADAVNCAMTLRTLVDHSIKPWMGDHGYESDSFGIRIGLDFGNNDSVLWAGYGYGGVGEVTATGLSVDMASKLQGMAGKNQLMLGQGLLDFVDWPEPYSRTKIKQKSGTSVSVPVVIPNLTKKDGSNLDYRMRLLAHEHYVKLTPLPISFRDKICGSEVIANSAFSLKCVANDDGNEFEYISTSHYLNKDVSLTFQLWVTVNGTRFNFPLKAKFSVINHGNEAAANEDATEHSSEYVLYRKKRPGYGGGYEPYIVETHNEHSKYRGLHTMNCRVFDSGGKILFCEWFGVLIK